MSNRVRLLGVCLAVVVVAAPASSQAQKPPKPDPNEKVCETIIMTGSRLGKKRVCASRSEWEQRRREERKVLEEVQTRICVINPATGTCSGG